MTRRPVLDPSRPVVRSDSSPKLLMSHMSQHTPSFEPPQRLFSKEHLPVGIRGSHSKLIGPELTQPASGKKEQRFKAVTLHMPRRLACGSPSPVLRTDASARSQRSRIRQSGSAVSLRPSSPAAPAGTQQTHASRAGSSGGEVHPLRPAHSRH
jgi:hypothetical protein